MHKTKSPIINYWPIIMINYLGYTYNSIGYSYLVITTDSSVLSNGVSERIRKAYEKFGLKVVFKSGPTLRSLLTRVKDPLPMEKLGQPLRQTRTGSSPPVVSPAVPHHPGLLGCRWFLHGGDGTNEW